MKKIIIYIFIILLSLSLIISVGGYFIAKKYEKEITSSVVGELNKMIETEINVDDINFSILRHFPKASLQFDNVFIHSTKAFLQANPDKDTLLWARRMSLDFNIIDIFNGNYSLNQLQLKGAVVKMQIDKNGLDNFHFTKANTSEHKTKFSIDLKKVILNKVDYSFDNTENKTFIDLYAKHFILRGNLSNKEFGLSTSGSLLLQKIELNKIDYLMSPNASLNVDLWVNNSKVVVKKGRLKVGEEYLEIKGTYEFNNKSYLDLVVNSKQVGIKNILHNLPKAQQEIFFNYEAKGDVEFELLAKGDVSKNKTPDIEITARVKQAELKNLNNNISLKALCFNAHFVSKESRLSVKEFSGALFESRAKGNFTIVDFAKPIIKADFELDTDLKEIKQFFDLDSLTNLQGQVKANINISGQLNSSKHITKSDIRTFKTSGRIDVSNAEAYFVNTKKLNFKHLNAQLTLENNNIIIDSLGFYFGQSNAIITGKAYNTLAYILVENETIKLNGKLYSDSLNMADLLSPNQKEDKNINFSYPKHIACRLELSIKKFVYNKFEAQQLYAQFYLNKDITQVNDFRMNTSKGVATGQMLLKPLENNKYQIDINSNFSDIDIRQIMFELDNFGQKSFLYTNLNGRLSAISNFKALLNSDLSFNKESLELHTIFNIKNGELNNYKPLYSLSKFIELSDLENIKFDNFHNTIDIKNKVVYIPKMEIKSNAVNLSMSGTHNFNNEFTYRMKVELSEILGRKAKANKKENKEFSFIEDDGRGRTALFLLIKGKDGNITVKYDGKSVKAHIKEGIREEKNELKNILNEEFGLFKNDSAVIKAKKKAKNKSTKNNFQIEWDED